MERNHCRAVFYPGTQVVEIFSMLTLKMARCGAALAFTLALAACGTSGGDRALSGAAIGAGAGAVLGAVTGGDPGTGAAIGAVAGGVVGAATSPCDLSFGDPAWQNRRDARRDYRRECGRDPG
jgi:hypothetical protein